MTIYTYKAPQPYDPQEYLPNALSSDPDHKSGSIQPYHMKKPSEN